MNLNNPKKFSIVGGKENADFIFQSAIDDKSENKNWKLIVANLNSVTINNAKKWFMSITSNQTFSKDRWTSQEDELLIHYTSTNVKISQIIKYFPHRSKKSIEMRIMRLKEKKKKTTIKDEAYADNEINHEKENENQMNFNILDS